LPIDLVWLVLCWAWEESKNVTDAFEEAKDQCQQLGVSAVGTYQGMMKALVRHGAPLLRVLWSRLHQLLQEIGGEHWQIDGWVLIAFDGSRSSAPRTESNEQGLCAPNYGKGATAKYRKKKTKGMRRKQNEKNKPQAQQPQAWITMMWHMGLRLPWTWRLVVRIPASGRTSKRCSMTAISRRIRCFAAMRVLWAIRSGRGSSHVVPTFWSASART
jgi:hypothetical protein